MNIVGYNPEILAKHDPLSFFKQHREADSAVRQVQGIEQLEFIERPDAYSQVQRGAEEQLGIVLCGRNASHLFDMPSESVDLLLLVLKFVDADLSVALSSAEVPIVHVDHYIIEQDIRSHEVLDEVLELALLLPIKAMEADVGLVPTDNQ